MTFTVTFRSQFDAILANRTLLGAGLAVQMMPVPRAVSASCGTCVRFQADAPPPALERLEKDGVFYQQGDLWMPMEGAPRPESGPGLPDLGAVAHGGLFSVADNGSF